MISKNDVVLSAAPCRVELKAKAKAKENDKTFACGLISSIALWPYVNA